MHLAAPPTVLESPARLEAEDAPSDLRDSHRRPSGSGRIEWRQVRGRTVVTTVSAASPLRLLTPARHEGSSWVFASTFGGGLLAGDMVDLSVVAGEGTTALLGTQASTKIYRSADGRPATQTLHATVERAGTLVVLPDPITCFADAVYVQRMRLDLAADANLVLLDWLTSGRRAMGERWAFRRYDSRIDVRVNDKLILRDATLLDPADGSLASHARMGRFNCMALAMVIGPAVEQAARLSKAFVDGQPIAAPDGMLISASLLPGGILLRAAGPDTQTVCQWMRERLTCGADLLGEDPWRRKF